MHADPADVVSVVIERMRRSMGARPLPPLDEVAFDTALGVFHRTYTASFRPVVASEGAQAHDEATQEALEAFLGCYIEVAGLTR